MAKEIRSPLPGTFYRKPSPEAAPFVEDGASVAVGDVIGLVEVMKSFHEVKAEVEGVAAAACALLVRLCHTDERRQAAVDAGLLGPAAPRTRHLP